MPNDTDTANLTWMRGFDADESSFAPLGWWLTGGVTLLAWTGLALLLTA